MRKIVLGQTPKNFHRLVTVTLPDGEQTEMGVTFKYRTRTELAKFADDVFTEGNKEKSASINTISDVVLTSVEDDAKALMEALDGWNLESEFNLKNATRFCDEMPQAALDILQNYFFSSTKARKGN